MGLQLRADLQSAIDEERYQDAAKIRDKLSDVERDELAAALTMATGESRSKSYVYRLGQRIVHKDDKWQGLICGFDPMCCETEEWQKEAKIENLSQPFYQVLVDAKATGSYDVAYVPQDRILAFEDAVGESEMEDVSEVEHPYTYLLFFGMDAKGNYIPTRGLREKYKVERYIDPSLMVDEDDDGDDTPNTDADDKPSGDGGGDLSTQ
mmetsp:Transcript_13017/g.24853  ORF Transcript_13017/g.24853 Transcript_13017/m.24853 type:complete len:208 (+) Transcript_13017:163-786(+)